MRGFKANYTMLIALALAACAPASSSLQTRGIGITALAFNSSGTLGCIANGKAYLYANRLWSALPAPASASSLIWRDGAWWLALPNTGLVYKATGVPENLSFTGRPVLLSNRLVFTLEGEVRTYGGALIGRLRAVPQALLETAETTYALVGPIVYAIAQGIEQRRVLSSDDYSLLAGENGFVALPGLVAQSEGYLYRLDGTRLIALNNAARESARVNLAFTPTQLIAGEGLVAVSGTEQLEVYSAGGLLRLYAGRCGGAT